MFLFVNIIMRIEERKAGSIGNRLITAVLYRRDFAEHIIIIVNRNYTDKLGYV